MKRSKVNFTAINKVRFTIILMGMGILPLSALAIQQLHVVKSGEVLSRIARRYFGAPTYSPQGALAKILQLNPEIRNQNQIEPNQTLKLTDAHRTLATSDSAAIATPSESQDQSNANGNLQVALEYSFQRIDAIDSSTQSVAYLLSKSSFAMPITYTQFWNADFSSFESLVIRSFTVMQPLSKTVAQNQTTLFGFSVGAGFFQSRRNRFALEVGISQEPFIVATGLNSLEIVQLPVSFSKLSSEHDLFSVKPFTLGLNLALAYRFAASSSDVTAHSGYEGDAGIYLNQSFRSSRLRIGTSYKYISQSTSISTQSKKEITMSVGYAFDLGTSAEKEKEK